MKLMPVQVPSSNFTNMVMGSNIFQFHKTVIRNLTRKKVFQMCLQTYSL